MNTYAFKPIQCLVVGLLLTLTTCKEEVIDEYPKILSMSLPGIPPENITIDQAQHLITVLLPPTLPSLELVPTFSLSRRAYLSPYWTKNQPVVFSLTSYCPCQSNSRSPVILESYARVDNQRHATEYTVEFKGSGPLRIKSLATPLVYDLTSTRFLSISVETYYSNSPVVAYSVTRQGAAAPSFLIPGCSCSEKNAIMISLVGYSNVGVLQPGLHDLDLWLADGTKVHAEGAILVK